MKISNNFLNLNSINFQGKKVNLIVFNDVHGSIKHIDSFTAKQDSFYMQNPDGINLTLCGGDLFLSKNPNNEIIAAKVAKAIDAVAVGNHDIEAGNYLAKLIDRFSMFKKWLSVNIRFDKETPLKNKILRSVIVEKNKEKIGIIGVSPFDFDMLSFKNEKTDFITTAQLPQTIQEIKKEVEALRKQNVNIILLLAHTGEMSNQGENYYEQFAKISGIDVVIGGHDHKEVDKWAVSEDGEPVKIIATGKNPKRKFGENLDVIGELSLDFDDNGVLNKEKSTTTFISLEEDKTTQSPAEIIREIGIPLIQSDVLREHSEIGNLVADSNLWYVNKHTKGKKADFALVNPGTIRANFDNPNVTMADIQSVLPFISNTLLKTTLTKKQIIETLEWGALSTTFPKVSPGIIQVSNMEYTINQNLTVSNVHILNDDGTIKYNFDDFSDDKKFTVVYDTFLATGVAGLTALTKVCENNPDVELFGISRQEALREYLLQAESLMDYKRVRLFKK